MAILSGLFGSSDSGNSSDLLSILDLGASVDASNSSYEQTIDDDGSSQTSASQSQFGADLDFGSILSNVTNNFSDSDNGGGIFG